MPSILPGFEYDIFISYRHKDNQYDGWVTSFVDDLKKELAATIKEDISVYFDTNTHDGLNENHDVGLSLEEKVNCAVFIPVISQTYCDPNCFAWKNEFLPFLSRAQKEPIGLKIKVANGNVASRVLPVRIHELDDGDLKAVETTMGGILRAIDFTFKSTGINRPLKKSDRRDENFNKTLYRDQINKVANAFKEILYALRSGITHSVADKSERFATSIPLPATPLLGRDREMNEVLELLKTNRVVTILGPGGTGKTRLALELSLRLQKELSGNVVFVSLAAVTTAEDVMPALANNMGIKEAEGRDLFKGISSVIGDRKTFIVMDNLEQVIKVAPQVAELISNCRNLTIVTTSRTPLKIRAEYEYALHPLSLPSGDGAESIEHLVSYPSVQLFVDRAKKVSNGFEFTKDNANDIVKICRKLDGLPLALELAAARIRMMPPKHLSQKLEHALDILTGGAKDLPERHQTLRTTIDWSHTMLTEQEKKLFRRMAVFSGGCTMDAIEETCQDNHSLLAFADLESLVDKALVQHDGTSGRFMMLQTIKEYALDNLQLANEGKGIKLKQGEHFLKVAAQICRGIEQGSQAESIRLGILEGENFQSVLEFLLQEARTGNVEAEELGMMICGKLYFYWHIRGTHIVARHFATSFLNVPICPPISTGKCLALNTAGIAMWTLGQFDKAHVMFQDCYDMARTLGIKDTMAMSAVGLFLCYLVNGKLEECARVAKEVLDISHEIDSDYAQGFGHVIDGMLHSAKGELDAARESFDRALLVQSKLNEHEGMGLSLGGLAQLSSIRENFDDAIRYYQEALDHFRIIGDRAEEARIQEEIAWVYLRANDTGEARRSFVNSIHAYEDIGSVRGIGLALLGIACVEAVEGKPAKAIEFATAAELFAAQEGVVNFYGEGFAGKTYIENARKELSPEQCSAAVDTGKKLSLKEALLSSKSTLNFEP